MWIIELLSDSGLEFSMIHIQTSFSFLKLSNRNTATLEIYYYWIYARLMAGMNEWMNDEQVKGIHFNSFIVPLVFGCWMNWNKATKRKQVLLWMMEWFYGLLTVDINFGRNEIIIIFQFLTETRIKIFFKKKKSIS